MAGHIQVVHLNGATRQQEHIAVYKWGRSWVQLLVLHAERQVCNECHMITMCMIMTSASPTFADNQQWAHGVGLYIISYSVNKPSEQQRMK